ncbi:hypothetical protein TREMEDRAFT_57092, partial [Tremella mesenterica DSM 1558]|uniref:uncharacterized protein n=1 Tax=Tremella mesenterica (strain ATCC 24925 / CBS 8224 / DSM 1558 / NBRC 9311 / NRRL Y-6157 / RJB 2259-6 / UBC 559-6) TaxID=578456 RepID=UPI0003F4980F
MHSTIYYNNRLTLEIKEGTNHVGQTTWRAALPTGWKREDNMGERQTLEGHTGSKKCVI